MLTHRINRVLQATLLRRENILPVLSIFTRSEKSALSISFDFKQTFMYTLTDERFLFLYLFKLSILK